MIVSKEGLGAFETVHFQLEEFRPWDENNKNLSITFIYLTKKEKKLKVRFTLYERYGDSMFLYAYSETKEEVVLHKIEQIFNHIENLFKYDKKYRLKFATGQLVFEKDYRMVDLLKEKKKEKYKKVISISVLCAVQVLIFWVFRDIEVIAAIYLTCIFFFSGCIFIKGGMLYVVTGGIELAVSGRRHVKLGGAGLLISAILLVFIY